MVKMRPNGSNAMDEGFLHRQVILNQKQETFFYSHVFRKSFICSPLHTCLRCISVFPSFARKCSRAPRDFPVNFPASVNHSFSYTPFEPQEVALRPRYNMSATQPLDRLWGNQPTRNSRCSQGSGAKFDNIEYEAEQLVRGGKSIAKFRTILLNFITGTSNVCILSSFFGQYQNRPLCCMSNASFPDNFSGL